MKRKNPNFNYRDFLSKRKEIERILINIRDFSLTDGLVDKLKKILIQNTDFFELLKYTTPYYVEVLAKGLRSIVFLEHDLSCQIACAVLDEQDEGDIVRLKKWVCNKIHELYGLLRPDIIGGCLNDFIRLYNIQNEEFYVTLHFPTAQNSIELENVCDRLSSLDRAFLPHRNNYAQLGVRLSFAEGNIQSISVDNGCFVSLLYSYLVIESFLYPDLVTRGRQYHSEVYYDEDAEQDTWDIKDQFDFDNTKGTRTMPLWLFAFPYSVNLFSINIHGTRVFDGQGAVTITPKNLKTKLIDYTFAPYATHGRKLESTTFEKTNRGLVFGYDKDFICSGAAQRTRDYLGGDSEAVNNYGDNNILIFANTSLMILKPTDESIQTVNLLQDIVETIPCKIEQGYRGIKASFGLQSNKTEPLYSVISSECESFEQALCDVVDLICDYLNSDHYDPAYNINQTLF